MSATVLSFFRPAPVTTGDWSQQELAEFYRVEAASVQAGLRLSLDRGLSDEGDPWLVFCREDGEVFLHFARIDGSYVIWSGMIERPLTGPDFRALLAELVSQHPSVLPLPRDAANGRRGAQILMHPAALLAAIVATACLFSSMNEAVASELETGPHPGSHPGEGPATPDAASLGDIGHKPPVHTAHGSEGRAHDSFERELTLITGVILACIATYANEHQEREGATTSPLTFAADGHLTSGRSVADAAALVESVVKGQAETASRTQVVDEGFKPLAETAISPFIPAPLHDLRSGVPLTPAASSLPLLSFALEPATKLIVTGDATAPVARGAYLIAGFSNGSAKVADQTNSRGHAGPAADPGPAGGDSHGGGSDARGAEAPPAPSGSPATSDSSRGITAASAGDSSAPRSTTPASTDTGAARTSVAGTGSDTGKGSPSTATPAAGESTKMALAPTSDSSSVGATLTKALAANSGALVLGTGDLSIKGIGAIFSDLSALSSKTVSLLLHALVDIQPNMASKVSSDTPVNAGGGTNNLAGVTASVESATVTAGSGTLSSSPIDAGHAVAKAADSLSSAGTAIVTTPSSTIDGVKAALAPSDTSKMVAASSLTGGHSTDNLGHANPMSSPASATATAVKADAVIGSMTPGAGASADATVPAGPSSGLSSAGGSAPVAVTTGPLIDTKAPPAVAHQPDQTPDVDALHTVAALTSSSNTVSRAVSVSLATSATVLDAVQLRIIDLFLQSTPDAKFRTVDNTLEIYNPSASGEISAHAAVWDIGGGAYVRVIGISDTHVVS